MDRLLALVLALVAATAQAEEGMWPFNHLPLATLAKQHGFSPDPAWVDHVRASSLKLGQGCSASFVSGRGLVMTNFHCIERCVEQLSSAKEDLLQQGFLARAPATERRCPDLTVSRLTGITDVTARVQQATAGRVEQAFTRALQAETARIEQECADGERAHCEVVTLYRGGQYHLYRFERFDDVRLVFAPEEAIALFGGDPDNFNFPRFDLDVSFLRVYADGKPLATPEHFAWSAHGAAEGELTFTSGNPGSTDRLLTTAQLAQERDHKLPARIFTASELRGQLTQYRLRSPDAFRTAMPMLYGTENGLKVAKGKLAALTDPAFFAAKLAEENALRARVAKDPALKTAFGDPWAEIEAVQPAARALRARHALLEHEGAFSGRLFGIARKLVRAAQELPKPNEQRLREFTEAHLRATRRSLLSPAPIHPELETLGLAFSLGKLREELGADDPVVKKLLGDQSPEELATALVKGTRLAELAERQRLLQGGAAAIAASKDPMIRFAAAADPDARAVRAQWEETVDSVYRRAGDRIAQARFKLLGDSVYPDATGTPRLSFGVVRGWSEGDREIPAFTTLGGAFTRATGRAPFALPKSWLAARQRLALELPMNLVTTNDIIGGNSGSPVLNRAAEVVGVAFDGNRHSHGGAYGFDERLQRCVVVHSAAILEALAKVYQADALVAELRPNGQAGLGGR